MGRPYDRRGLLRLFETIRREIPAAALRTTLLVGFPGETEADFEDLLDFVKTVRFDHLGVFTYSDGEDLPSHRLKGQVASSVAAERRDRLMEAQAGIALEINRCRGGSTPEALVEAALGKGRFACRTAFQAPEVDGILNLRSRRRLSPGRRVRARITGAEGYDLTGEFP